MKAYLANVLNGLLLIIMPAWAYFTSETPSPTMFIPSGFGVALLLCAPGLKREGKFISHIAVLLTLIALVGVVFALKGAIGRGNELAIFRVSTMTLSSLIAMFFFIKSFVDVRRNRKTNS